MTRLYTWNPDDEQCSTTLDLDKILAVSMGKTRHGIPADVLVTMERRAEPLILCVDVYRALPIVKRDRDQRLHDLITAWRGVQKS